LNCQQFLSSRLRVCLRTSTLSACAPSRLSRALLRAASRHASHRHIFVRRAKRAHPGLPSYPARTPLYRPCHLATSKCRFHAFSCCAKSRRTCDCPPKCRCPARALSLRKIIPRSCFRHSTWTSHSHVPCRFKSRRRRKIRLHSSFLPYHRARCLARSH